MNRVDTMDYRFTFGKHKGKLIREIATKKPKYVQWLLTRDINVELREAIDTIQKELSCKEL